MILHRYLFREILYTLAAVLVVLVVVVASNRLVRFLADAAAGAIPADVVFELLVLKMIANLELLLPLSLYVAVLLALGRLYRDSEITAMTAGGVGLARLAAGMVGMLLFAGGVVAALSLYVAPTAAQQKEEIYERIKSESSVTGILPGRFKEFGAGDQVVYVERLDPDRRRMSNVFVQVREEARLDLLVAESAYQTVDRRSGDRYVVLENGSRYTGNPGDLAFVVTDFNRHALRIGRAAEASGYRKMDAMSTLALLRSDSAGHLAELQWRISLPISVVLLGLLAVPLARTSPRQGRYAKLFTATLIYFLYNNLLGMAQTLVEQERLSALIGVWPVHALLAAVIVVSLSRATYGGMPMPRLRRRRNSA